MLDCYVEIQGLANPIPGCPSFLSLPLWRTASLRSAPHQQTPEPVYIVVDKLVHCDPNMYS